MMYILKKKILYWSSLSCKADIDPNSCVLNISEVLSLHELLQCKLITDFAYVFDLKIVGSFKSCFLGQLSYPDEN